MLPFVQAHIKPKHVTRCASIANKKAEEESQILIDLHPGWKPLDHSAFTLAPPHGERPQLIEGEVIWREEAKGNVAVFTPIPNRLCCIRVASLCSKRSISFSDQTPNRGTEDSPEFLLLGRQGVLEHTNEMDLRYIPFTGSRQGHPDWNPIPWSEIIGCPYLQTAMLKDVAGVIWRQQD